MTLNAQQSPCSVYEGYFIAFLISRESTSLLIQNAPNISVFVYFGRAEWLFNVSNFWAFRSAKVKFWPVNFLKSGCECLLELYTPLYFLCSQRTSNKNMPHRLSSKRKFAFYFGVTRSSQKAFYSIAVLRLKKCFLSAAFLSCQRWQCLSATRRERKKKRRQNPF